jgi:hypothetical protein
MAEFKFKSLRNKLLCYNTLSNPLCIKIAMKLILKLALALLSFNVLLVNAVEPSSPSDTPPQMENLDEGTPAVTQSKREHIEQTEHTSQVGEQTEVRVTNEVGTYIVKPNQSVGTSLPGDAQSSSNHAVQWIVKSWGGSRNTTEPTASPPTLPENPDNPTTDSN